MKKNQKIKLLFIFLCLFLLGAGFVFALEINYPRVPGAVPPQEFLQSASASPEQIPSLYIKYIFNLFFWVSGIIILGVLLWAGFRYLTSAGKTETTINARGQITSAFLGILILLSSFIILNILNPQLIILKLPKIEPVKVIERTEVPLPAITTEMTRTAIDTELPLGKLLDDYLFASSTMSAVRKNATTTLDITDTLRKQSEDLKNKTDKCSCSQTKPQCSPCVSGKSCTCDTCDSVRNDIENTERNNLQKLDELKEQQKISIDKMKEVKIELAKLRRIEQFIKECPTYRISSLPQFLYDKDFYIAQNWTLRDVKFWEKIIIGEDWVTLYCPVSGTILGETPGIPAESITEELLPVEPPSAEQQMACTTKIPVGEIIDRAERIASRLINRLETLIDLGRQMIQAVDEMHVLVSQCTSQIPRCYSICIPTEYGCIEECVGSPCPSDKIAQQAQKIAEIQEKIKVVVNEENEQNIGIIPVVDKVVPKLLEDLDKLVRRPTKECITDVPVENAAETTEPQVILSDCESAVRAVGPNGVIIQKCCLTETAFKGCLQQCYLKSGQDYEKCLNDCLKNTNNEEVSICNHKINFYCCGL